MEHLPDTDKLRMEQSLKQQSETDLSADSKPSIPDYYGHRARMRQKLLDKGSQSLSDIELLELILMTAIPRRDVKPLAKQLMRQFVTFSCIIHADIHELKQIKGIGDSVISLLKIIEGSCRTILKPAMQKDTVLKEWNQIIDYCRFNLSHEKQEHLYLIYLDVKMRLITIDDFQKGSESRIHIIPNEILKRALNLGATSLILIHNHPSGTAKPSREDLHQTSTLNEFLMHAGISIFDHLIVANQVVYSINQRRIVSDLIKPKNKEEP